jgi:hypothetical protein
VARGRGQVKDQADEPREREVPRKANFSAPVLLGTKRLFYHNFAVLTLRLRLRKGKGGAMYVLNWWAEVREGWN